MREKWEYDWKEKNKKKILRGFLKFGAAAIMLLLARLLPGFADWYAKTIYKILVNIFGRIFGLFPFSVIEFMIYIVILLLFLKAYLFIKMWITERRLPKERLQNSMYRFVSTAGGLFLTFVLTCGIQYSAASFSEEAGLKTGEYTTEDLITLANQLTGEANDLSGKVRRSEDGTLYLEGNYREKGVYAMRGLGEIYPELQGYYPKPKKVTFSSILSVQNLTGVYSPFTIEANFNGDMTSYNIPFTICHELSHLTGYMREDEANYIAYLACMNSDSEEFQYSGTLTAWIYTMNTLYKYDREEYEKIYQKLDPDVLTDLQANREFWNQYEGRTAEIAKKVNDTYLKANNQKDGVDSYDKMVDLLVAYHLRTAK